MEATSLLLCFSARAAAKPALTAPSFLSTRGLFRHGSPGKHLGAQACREGACWPKTFLRQCSPSSGSPRITRLRCSVNTRLTLNYLPGEGQRR